MLEDFLSCLAFAICVLASIIVARGGVEMMLTEGKHAWKAWAGSLALTILVGAFVGERMFEIPFNDYFGKVMALCVVQTLAFAWFRSSGSQTSSSRVS
jgi:hypothetical protein